MVLILWIFDSKSIYVLRSYDQIQTYSIILFFSVLIFDLKLQNFKTITTHHLNDMNIKWTWSLRNKICVTKMICTIFILIHPSLSFVFSIYYFLFYFFFFLDGDIVLFFTTKKSHGSFLTLSNFTSLLIIDLTFQIYKRN